MKRVLSGSRFVYAYIDVFQSIIKSYLCMRLDKLLLK